MQKIKLEVRCDEGDSYEIIGDTDTNIAYIVGSPNSTATLNLKDEN